MVKNNDLFDGNDYWIEKPKSEIDRDLGDARLVGAMMGAGLMALGLLILLFLP